METNLENLIIKLQEAASKGLQAGEAARIQACLKFMGELKRRVFHEGKDINGQQIGKYSTEEMYVSISGAQKKYGSQIRASSLKPGGKDGTNTTKVFDIKSRRGKKVPITSAGNERKSMYFKNGYAGFRQTVGRPIDKVNLYLTGSLMNSIKEGISGDYAVVAFATEKMSIIARGHEKKYGKSIFAPSESEFDSAADILQAEVEKAFFDSI